LGEPDDMRVRQAKDTPKSALLLTFYGNLLWFKRLVNFSLHIVENYDSCCPDGEHDKRQKTKKEPDRTAEGLIGRLGDAEGSKEGGCEGFQESHSSMVRGWVRSSMAQKRKGGLRIHKGTGTSNMGIDCGLLQDARGARLTRGSVRTQPKQA
jgi:hypothetical protein